MITTLYVISMLILMVLIEIKLRQRISRHIPPRSPRILREIKLHRRKTE